MIITSTSPTPAPETSGRRVNAGGAPSYPPPAEQRRTCCVDVKVRGLVGYVPRGLQAGSLGRGLAGVSLRLADLHLEGALRDVLPCEQHRHLESSREEELNVCNPHSIDW